MGIKIEAPEISELIGEQLAIVDKLEEMEAATGPEGLIEPQGQYSVAVNKLIENSHRLREMIESHPLTQPAELRFVSRIEDLIGHPKLSRGKISIMYNRAPFPRRSDDWFDCDYEWDGRILDNLASVVILHPRLFEIAKERWSNDPRVTFSVIPREDGGSYDDERVALLQQHGIPSDTSTWMWAYEALYFAEKGLLQLEIEFRLCDYVEWTCTAEPPNMWSGAIFGKPKLHSKALFGHRLSEEPSINRLDGCEIWKTAEGTYISPLWEYLQWSGSTHGELSIYANALGDIGKGIDRAIVMHDQDFDAASHHRLRLTATEIFRAGEALANLRIKLELGEVVDKGMKAEVVAQERSKRGGAKSAEARGRRISALVEAMECIVRDNPIVARFGPDSVASLAVEACAEADPALWTQGRGQIAEYVGEVRRGEAGAELRARFLVMFPIPAPRQMR